MVSKSSHIPEAVAQRIQVGIELRGEIKRLKICLQSHDDSLGWYTAGCLSIPLHQVPLLEQALEQFRGYGSSEETLEEKIIPFEAIKGDLGAEICRQCEVCFFRHEPPGQP